MVWFDRTPGGKKESLDPRPLEKQPDPGLNSARIMEQVPQEAAGEELVAHLCKGSRVTGQLTFHGSARIDGSVEGEVSCHGTLSVGEEAQVKARLAADVVVIRGRVEGDVMAKDRVELETPGRLFGNIAAPRVIISEGVVFEGYCSMGGSKDKAGLSKPRRSSGEKALEGGSSKVAIDLEK